MTQHTVEREVMVRWKNTWMLLRLTGCDLVDRVRFGVWNQLPNMKFADGFPSFESTLEMLGIPQERLRVA